MVRYHPVMADTKDFHPAIRSSSPSVTY